MDETQKGSQKSKTDAPEGLKTSELALGNHCNMTRITNQPDVTQKCFHDQNQRHPISTSGNKCGSKGRKPELPSKRWRRRNAEDFPSSSNHQQPSEHLRTSIILLRTWSSSSTAALEGRGSTRNLVNINQGDPIRSTSDSMTCSLPELVSLQVREKPGCLFHLLDRLFATQLKGDLFDFTAGIEDNNHKVQNPTLFLKQIKNR